MMDRLTEKKKEAIEQFTALEPVWTHGRGNRQCCSMDVLRRSLFVTGHAMAVDGGFLAR
jgi:hypothetical protein